MTQAAELHPVRASAPTPGLWLRHVVSGPFVYGLLIALSLLDLSVCIYQAVAFRLWGLARVPRREHIILDRHRLPYLNPIQRVNCVYCGYANGVLSFAREVAARTEQYWCPIKHAAVPPAPHARYDAFLDYGDDADVTARMDALRDALPPRHAKPDFGDAVAHLVARVAPYPSQEG